MDTSQRLKPRSKIKAKIVGIDLSRNENIGNQFEIEISEQESTVRELLKKLEDRFGKKLGLTTVYVNDPGISVLSGLNARLRDEDQVLIAPIVTGG